MELSRKKCKIAILLYCLHTAGVLHTFVIITFWTLVHLFNETNVLENYWIFSKSILWEPVMHSRVHFNISLILHSLVHFSINFIKRINCNECIQGSYSYCNIAYFPSILISVLWTDHFRKTELKMFKFCRF